MRNGKTPDQRQRYLCRNCHRRFCDHPRSQAYSEQERATILRAYQERRSLRGLTRTFGVARNTVTGWIKKKRRRSPALSQTVQPPENPSTGYVGLREGQDSRPAIDKPEVEQAHRRLAMRPHTQDVSMRR